MKTYLIVHEVDGSSTIVDASRDASIDAAVTQWMHEGRDSILYLTGKDGTEHRILASRIISWLVTTAASRRRHTEMEAESRQERRENRAAAGLPYEDDFPD